MGPLVTGDDLPHVAPQHQVTDAGRRLSEAHEVARASGAVGRYIAARLSDGRTDGNVYDTRDDAIRNQLDETQCAYLPVHPGVMPPAEATAWLALNRRIYDAGLRLSDPDAIAGARVLRAMPSLAAGLALPHNRAARRRAARNGTLR